MFLKLKSAAETSCDFLKYLVFIFRHVSSCKIIIVSFCNSVRKNIYIFCVSPTIFHVFVCTVKNIMA